MRLLLVEDDHIIGVGITRGLMREGYAVDWVQNGVAADLALDGRVTYDLVVLDLGLPRKDGLQVLAGMRQRGLRLPVLILTARDSVADRVCGLNSGADDYVVKPFDLDELCARVRALLRRGAGRSDPEIRVGALCVNTVTHEVTLDGRAIGLSAREYSLLLTLVESAGKPFSRADLEERLYGWDDEIGSNAVEVHIHSLRRKLGSDWIRNLRGVGYFVPRET